MLLLLLAADEEKVNAKRNGNREMRDARNALRCCCGTKGYLANLAGQNLKSYTLGLLLELQA